MYSSTYAREQAESSAPEPELRTLSTLQADLHVASRRVWQLENSLEDARNDLAEVQADIARKLYVCDHPDYTGHECDYCHEFAPDPEEYRDVQDRLRILDVDVYPNLEDAPLMYQGHRVQSPSWPLP